ncbi:TIGR03943 family putative permease subunit [Arthrobacter sp. D3-16]
MLFKRFAGGSGLLLGLIGIISTLGLGATGKLELYIHPRYIVFTLAMSLIAAALAVAALVLRGGHAHEDDGDDHHDGGGHSRLRVAGSLLTVTGAVVGLLVLPPSALTSATADQRDLNSSGTLSRHQTSQLINGDGKDFDVRDWASLLRHDAELQYLNGRTATITGFVTMDKANPAAVFFVTRFVTTCCTVDAQPVGVPVHHPGWQKDYKTDMWVTVAGTFRRNPDADAAAKTPTIFVPDTITPTSQPERPYLH